MPVGRPDLDGSKSASDQPESVPIGLSEAFRLEYQWS